MLEKSFKRVTFKTLSGTKGLFQDFLQQRRQPLELKEVGKS